MTTMGQLKKGDVYQPSGQLAHFEVLTDPEHFQIMSDWLLERNQVRLTVKSVRDGWGRQVFDSDSVTFSTERHWQVQLIKES